MFRLIRSTPFTYSPEADEGAGGGQSTVITELPENLKDKYVAIDKHNGTIGAFKQARDTALSNAERLSNEKSVLETQLTDLSTQLTQFKTEAAQAKELSSKVTEYEVTLKAQTDLNARLEVAMKYPGILDESTLALVKSSTLDATALENHLGKLAERLGTTTTDTSAGATKAVPNNTVLKPSDLMQEAETLRRKGDIRGFEAKLAEALGTMDAKEKFLPPQRPEL